MMSKDIKKTPELAQEANYYMEMLPLSAYLPINTGLSAAKEQTMISVLGPPQMPLTTTDQPERASALFKELKKNLKINNISITGIAPAIDSLGIILEQAFSQEALQGHDLKSVLSSQDMLNVRLRKPTSGKPSSHISNHSWGTAIDFRITGSAHPGDTGSHIPRFIACLLPFFNAAGWYSGIAFHDTMHFEVAEETIKKWSESGLLKPKV